MKSRFLLLASLAVSCLVAQAATESVLVDKAAHTITQPTGLQFKTANALLVGTDLQAFDADLSTWAGITPGSGVGTFLATPTSANLRATLTDESGNGVLLFAGGNIGAATGTSLDLSGVLAASNVTVAGNSVNTLFDGTGGYVTFAALADSTNAIEASSISSSAKTLSTAGPIVALNWNERILLDSAGVNALTWDTRKLVSAGGVDVLDFSAPNISVTGTIIAPHYNTSTFPTTGAGIELYYDTAAVIQSYNRDTTVWTPMSIGGEYVELKHSSFTKLATTTAGVNVTGSVVMDTAGSGIELKSGAGQRAGNATMVAGSVAVINATVTANTIVMLTRKAAGGTIGDLTYTLNAGSFFTINSSNALDTSTVSYLLIELN